jgi:hypothetical protein
VSDASARAELLLAEQIEAHRAHLRAVAHRRPGSTHPACCRWESVPTQGSPHGNGRAVGVTSARRMSVGDTGCRGRLA